MNPQETTQEHQDLIGKEVVDARPASMLDKWPDSGTHLNLLFQLPLEVLQLLGVGKLASGQLGDQCLLFLQLPGQLTCRGTEAHSTLEGQSLLSPPPRP